MYKTTVFLMCFVQKPEQFFCAIGCRIHRMIKRYWIFAVILWLKAQHNCWLRCKVEIFNDDINHCNRDLMCIQALWFNMSKIFVHLIHVKYMWCSQWWHVVRSKCVFILFFAKNYFIHGNFPKKVSSYWEKMLPSRQFQWILRCVCHMYVCIEQMEWNLAIF